MKNSSLRLAVLSAIGLPFLAGIDLAAQIIIPAATNGGAYAASSPGVTYQLNGGDTRSQNAGADGVTFGTAGTAGTYTLVINGSLIQTGTVRAIRTANVSAAAGHVFNLNVGSTGLVRSTVEDAVQGRFTGSGNLIFNVDNQGTIYSGPNLAANPMTPIATGQALDLPNARGGTITNGSVANTTALLRADGHDAVRLGSNSTFTNYGVVRGNSVVNDSSNNNNFNAAPNNSTAELFSTSEGVSFEEGSNSTLNNYGSISGSRHGVESAELATGATINNYAGGVIAGRNGSGIGFDATSASSGNVTILNNGEIRGDYAGAGNIIDRTGNASFTNDGDGDGIDIDGATNITNNGLIHSTGAGGFDSGGRANSAEGIAIGGGTIQNNAGGIIRGANRGILVNNDANLNRSAVAAASVTNAGTIEGQNGYGIRFEGNFSDSVTNSGTIIGTGTIPDPSATVVRQDGTTDPANGTLNGVTYGPGSGRFIRGDGAAIQTGDGNDAVTNSGTITGGSGRAVSLEGGNDSLAINGGSASIAGDINGGAGTDSLTFDLGSSGTFAFAATISKFETLSVSSGAVAMNGTMAFTLGGAVAGTEYDQIGLTLANGGSFTLGAGSVLDITLGFVPAEGTAFRLIDVANGGAVTGQFANLGEGGRFVAGGQTFEITYAGGSGNDVVVTAVPEPGTWALMALGGSGLIWITRRRRTAASRAVF